MKILALFILATLLPLAACTHETANNLDDSVWDRFHGDQSAQGTGTLGDQSVQGSGGASLAPSDFSRGIAGEVNLPRQGR